MLAAALTLGGQGAHAAAVDDAPAMSGTVRAPLQAPAAGAFGFAIGEERRYIIGPAEALEPGEGELWIIRLESIDGERPNQRIRFYLEHEATQFSRTPNVFSRGALMVFRGSMDLTVNEYGWPLHVGYRGAYGKIATQDSREEVSIRFEDGEFVIHNRFSMRFRHYQEDVPSSPLVDPTIPRGVFVSGAENPGLYSLILTGSEILEVGDVEFMALMPSSYAGTGGSGFNRRRGDQRNRSVQRTRLRFEELTTVDIGGIEEEAMRLRRPGGTRPDMYVGLDGTVLRVDMSTPLKRSAFIRLLRPYEY